MKVWLIIGNGTPIEVDVEVSVTPIVNVNALVEYPGPMTVKVEGKLKWTLRGLIWFEEMAVELGVIPEPPPHPVGTGNAPLGLSPKSLNSDRMLS